MSRSRLRLPLAAMSILFVLSLAFSAVPLPAAAQSGPTNVTGLTGSILQPADGAGLFARTQTGFEVRVSGNEQISIRPSLRNALTDEIIASNLFSVPSGPGDYCLWVGQPGERLPDGSCPLLFESLWSQLQVGQQYKLIVGFDAGPDFVEQTVLFTRVAALPPPEVTILRPTNGSNISTINETGFEVHVASQEEVVLRFAVRAPDPALPFITSNVLTVPAGIGDYCLLGAVATERLGDGSCPLLQTSSWNELQFGKNYLLDITATTSQHSVNRGSQFTRVAPPPPAVIPINLAVLSPKRDKLIKWAKDSDFMYAVSGASTTHPATVLVHLVHNGQIFATKTHTIRSEGTFCAWSATGLKVDGKCPPINTPYFEGLPKGGYQLHLSASNATGGQDSITIPFTIEARIKPKFRLNTTQSCEGEKCKAVVKLQLLEGDADVVTLNFAGTAAFGVDYKLTLRSQNEAQQAQIASLTADDPTITFQWIEGQTEAVFDLEFLDDPIGEGPETVELGLQVENEPEAQVEGTRQLVFQDDDPIRLMLPFVFR